LLNPGWCETASNLLEGVIRIITIEREYGCGSAGIARELARRLGWKLWDELLTQEIARLANCDQSVVEKREEHRDPPYYRLFKAFALGSWEGSPAALSAEMLDADSIVRLSERVVEQAADAGNCVIVGRGSQHFLRARKDTLRFFLYASRREKVRRLVSQGKAEADAIELVNTVDRDRASFIKKYFHVNWPNRSLYHAMLNTAAGDETVILAMMNFLQHDRSSLQQIEGHEANPGRARSRAS
jgi:cytidylate kinase